ncbi:MAG: TfoX/Sxy family protein [Candidatus Campbellbacteria bacterium]|nr:TfoX/Sxy family protein [Candidatus Campbellbacteria bacterium]
MDESFKDFVLDQLMAIPDVTARKMFGGFGLYAEGIFFAIISDNVLYVKTDNESKQKFIDVGMDCFRPSKEQVLKNYYEVPTDVLEDREVLTEWVLKAIHTVSRKKK